MGSDGGSAFPTLRFDRIGDIAAADSNGGMALRDWFAGQALAGLMASNISGTPTSFAIVAFKIADAMLAERATTEAP